MNQRQKKLIEELQRHSGFQTVEQISNILGVSSRTIHLDLKQVQSYLNKQKMQLEKKRGVGVRIRHVDEGETQLPEQEILVADQGMTSLERRMKMMQQLLFEGQTLSFNQLSEQFFVSKTSIKKDLDFVEKVLTKENQLRLVRNHQGTRLEGKELDIQKAFLQFNYLVFRVSTTGSQESQEKFKALEPYYGTDIIQVCSNLLYSYIRNHIQVISEVYVENLLHIFLILVFRLLHGHQIDSQVESVQVKELLFFKESAVRLLHKAALRLHFVYDNMDVEYLSQQLVANRLAGMPTEEQVIDHHFIEQFIQRVEQALSVNLKNDSKLTQQLMKHIPPMIYRLQHNHRVENPFAQKIKTEFSLTFNVLSVILTTYEHQFGVVFNDNELAFLTIYFQAALERGKLNKRILVVCPMGIATSELLVMQIKRIIPSLDIFEVASVAELMELDIQQFDVVISTVTIAVEHPHVLYVSPFLTQKDIEHIQKIETFHPLVQREQQKVEINALEPFLHVDTSYFDTTFANKEEMLTAIMQEAVAKGLVTPPFLKSVFEREQMGGTDLPMGVAIPHGNTIYVEQTRVILIKNQKKFKWTEYATDFVFLICISQKDILATRSILSSIYQLIDSPASLAELRTSKKMEDIIHILRKRGEQLDG